MENTPKKKILVVEDDVLLAKPLHERLVFAGFDVLVVPDATLGLQEVLQHRPDLVILDLMLPAGGGQTVLRGLRAFPHTAYIPVLVISGLKRDDDRETFAQLDKLGIEGFLGKPFEDSRLLEEVRRILKKVDPDFVPEIR